MTEFDHFFNIFILFLAIFCIFGYCYTVGWWVIRRIDRHILTKARKKQYLTK